MSINYDIMCASIVYEAYVEKGYFKPGTFGQVLKRYVAEKRELSGESHLIWRDEQPVATIMCSVDQGQLPVEREFPGKMAELRQQYGEHIGYFGRYAILPSWQGKLSLRQLFRWAVSEWSVENDIHTVVMIVNPNDISHYARYGARVVAEKEQPTDLVNAKGVLMVLPYATKPVISSLRYSSKSIKPTRQEACQPGPDSEAVSS